MADVLAFDPDVADVQGSASIILELTAGQSVRIESQDSTEVYGTTSGFYQSWFTGFLLFELA